MSNQEFEVGDEVQYKDEVLLYEITSIISDDDCFNIVNPHTGKEYPYRVEPVDGDDFFYVCEDDIELISKGEDIMEADAIAVEVDDEATYDYLKKLAKDNDFDINNNNAETHDTGTYGFTKTGDDVVDGMTFHCISARYIDEGSGYLDNYDYKKIDLDNELGKLKEFLEKDNKLEEFKGYEVDYKPSSDEIEIGCQNFRVDNVINLYELMDEISLKEVEYSNSITITKDELSELVEYLRG